MAEKFDAKKAAKEVKDIKNNIINPHYSKITGDQKVYNAQAPGGPNYGNEKASQGLKRAEQIEKQAEKAGVKLDSDTKRRLDKIKDRYTQAVKKSEFKQHQSDQMHKNNKQAHKDFVSGVTAQKKAARWER